MNNIAQKLQYIKWLKSIGIEYYFSAKKDSDISFIHKLNDHYTKKQGIGSDKIMVKESTDSPGPAKNTVPQRIQIPIIMSTRISTPVT